MKDLLNQDPKTKSIVDRPPACSSSNPDVKKKIDEYFDNNLYKDVNDVFGKMNSQRQFYTMPWTTIPNAQDEFAKWLYLNPKTCKEDQDFCLKYEDVRSKRPEMYNPNVNPPVCQGCVAQASSPASLPQARSPKAPAHSLPPIPSMMGVTSPTSCPCVGLESSGTPCSRSRARSSSVSTSRGSTPCFTASAAAAPAAVEEDSKLINPAELPA